MNRRQPAFAGMILLGLGLLAACEDASEVAAAESQPCDDVCDHLESLCGSRPAGCESGCAQLNATERGCVLEALSCKDANNCSAPEPDAGTQEDGGAEDAGQRCSNGYLLGSSSCTGPATLEGCQATPTGTPITVLLECSGEMPACLEVDEGSASTDDNVGGCCPAGLSTYDPASCASQ
jgi:hypothetical protein